MNLKRYKIFYLLNPVYEDLPDGVNVKLARDFSVWVNGEKISAPAGFVSDLASIPWLFRRSLPRKGPWSHAAIIHDKLYRDGHINGREITQGHADRIMYAMMLYNPHVPRRKAWYIYVGLRLGGFAAWSKYRSMDGKKQE
jgi:hypothetical protein